MCNMWSYAATFVCSVCEKIKAHFSVSSLPEFFFVGASVKYSPGVTFDPSEHHHISV